jgi:outer membrane lipoprotein carrier protein
VKLQKRRGVRWATAIVAVALTSVPGLSRGKAAFARGDLFDDLYARGQQQNAGLKTLTAAFTETSTSPLLTRPLVARGRVYVERPSRVVLRYTDPEERIVLVDGDLMTLSWPSAKIRTTKDIGASQRRIQKYFIDSSPQELRSHFEIAADEAGDRPGTYLVTMAPRRKQIREGVARLELWLDRATLLMSAMRMTFPGGETKLMTFTDVKPNAPIDPAIFAVGSGL